jgi:hypothetical protein
MPGNLAELRPLVFIAAFVGFILLIVGMMASETPTLFVDATTGSGSTPISAPNPLGLVAWNSTLNFTLSHGAIDDFGFGGYNVRLGSPDLYLYFRSFTYANWWIFNWDVEDFDWYNSQNVKESVTYGALGSQGLALSQMTTDYETYGISGLRYTWKNSKTTIPVSFLFNETAYDSPTEAFNDAHLYIFINSNFATAATSFNALTFISGLFTFSLPGIPTVVNALLWVIIFPPLGYLTFVFVLKIIGAVFGGG